MKKSTLWLIVTDLDGTLMDHFTYSMEPAIPLIQRLTHAGIPVIPCSSKTRAEIEPVAKTISPFTPFVIENGAEIIFPDEPEKDIVLGTDRDMVIAALHEMAEELNIRVKGFSSFTPEELARITGLTSEQARNALARRYTEPFLLDSKENDNRMAMDTWCKQKGFRLLKGGRFYHLQGIHDKGMAIEHIRQVYKSRNKGMTVKVVAAGDSENDLDMLHQADFPVLVKKHDGTYVSWHEKNDLYLTEGIGPQGWCEAIEYIIFKRDMIS